jgi:hypothetical protein
MALATISRNRVLVRGQYGWELGTVPFSKTEFHQPDGYRQDAAGFISMCYDIPLHASHSWGGMSVVTLLTDGWMEEIKSEELRPGDAIGHLGPYAMDADGGVISLFEGWLNNDPNLGYALVYEQLPSGNPGPQRKARPFDFRWHAYRLKGIID